MVRSIVSIFSLPSLTYALSPECQRYLDVKGMGDVWQLKGHFDHYSEVSGEYPMPCQEDFYQQSLYMPNPAPYVPGSMDTSDLSCRYGNIAMMGGGGASCCGVKPHFNWVVGTCEAGSSGQFCRNVPACATSSGVQINYVAAYQFDGAQWVMMDDSTAGNIEDWGVYGNHAEGTGWESAKNGFGWQGGDLEHQVRALGTRQRPRGSSRTDAAWCSVDLKRGEFLLWRFLYADAADFELGWQRHANRHELLDLGARSCGGCRWLEPKWPNTRQPEPALCNERCAEQRMHASGPLCKADTGKSGVFLAA